MGATFSFRSWAVVGVVLAMVATLAFALGSTLAAQRAEQRLLAVSWGDGRYGPAFYGAYVFIVPDEAGFRVHARVAIGRGNGMFHDCGELGRVTTETEAVARFGRVSWEPSGLSIGTGPSRFFLPRAELERHR
jgi:hypothetical protein